MAGDRIIEVDDTIVAGVKMKQRDVMKRLRGKKGTRVNVKVVRNGEPKPLQFNITRDDIPIHSVEASYMADLHTGLHTHIAVCRKHTLRIQRSHAEPPPSGYAESDY